MRLNFGSGTVHADGWVNLDSNPAYDPDIVADIRHGLPFEDGTFDVIVANHSLQMLNRVELPDALVELRRVCKPGGVMRVLVPDLLAAFAAYAMGDLDHFQLTDEIAAGRDAKLCTYITQGGSTRSVFTLGYLTGLLSEAGWFPSVGEPGKTLGDGTALELDSRLGESLIVEARPCV